MIYDLLIALIFIGYDSVEIVRKVIFRKPPFFAISGFSIALTLVFGVYLLVKNGLILDYGSPEDVQTHWAGMMWFMAVICIFLSLVYIVNFIILEIKHYFFRK